MRIKAGVKGVGYVTIDMGILIAVLGLVVAAAGYFAGKWATAKSVGERWGKVETKLEIMDDSIKRLESSVSTSLKDYREEFHDGLKRVHARLDDHIRHEHGSVG